VLPLASLLRAEFPAPPREVAHAGRPLRGADRLRLPRLGEPATGQNKGTASLYQYFAATVVILILVSLLPPNRADNWLRFKRD
jgi:hypothetical protein